MALRNKIDSATAASRLQEWLAGRMPAASDLAVAGVEIPQSSGMSSETVLFEVTWAEGGEQRAKGMVARVAPSAEGIFEEYDLHRDGRVMEAVRESTDVAVARVLFYEGDDHSVLGGPFLVVERHHGRVPADDPPFGSEGWVTELDADGQARLFDSALRSLVAVGETDMALLSGLGLIGDPARGGVLDQQIDYCESYFRWSHGGQDNLVVETALDWLRANQPPDDGEPVLSWGDARPGNLMFGEDLEPTAVMDWEMASIGPRELDLCFFLFANRAMTTGIGFDPPPGFPSDEETLARWEELVGRPARDLEFHMMLAGTRQTIIMHRVGLMMIDLGLMPPGAPFTLANPQSIRMAELLGLPSPAEAGATGAWITGHRDD